MTGLNVLSQGLRELTTLAHWSNRFRAMSGYDDLNRGMGFYGELGPDDSRTQEALYAAIESGDLDDESLGLAYSVLGSALHATGEQQKAKEALTKATELLREPTLLANAHHELGETLFVLERESEAETHYRRALEYDRNHTYAPDTLQLLGKADYSRSAGDAALLEEAYSYFDESLALLTSPDGEKYGTFFGRPKGLFDGTFGAAICKSEMPGDKHGFEAVELFKAAEQLALDNRDAITGAELENTYKCWMALLVRMGLEREAHLVADRATRSLGA